LAVPLAACLLFPAFLSLADDWPQWRGPARDGHSRESGLLQEWPQEGPKLLWQVDHVGSGYAAPSVVGERLYLLGNDGLENEFVLAASTRDGQRLWSTRLGKVGNPQQKPNFPAARSTPTVDGEVLFALGSDGDLACVEIASGKVRWQKNLRSDFGGKPGDWAYSESPLVDGKTLICTPGGPDATLLALDKATGAVMWQCAIPGGENAAYASAIAVETAGIRQYVQMLEGGLAGVLAANGQLAWRYGQTKSAYRANIPTPVARGNRVFSAGAGTGGGLVELRKADQDRIVAEPVYFSPKLPSAIGGALLVGDYLYGAGRQNLVCADFTSGELKWEESALGPAALCFAGGRLYLHGENGEVGLVEPSPEGYREKGRFTPPNRPKRSEAMEKSWAYPVVAHGRFYLRDHAMLWCYDVRVPGGAN
jgi:outer membrane protein assembly factor BamB